MDTDVLVVGASPTGFMLANQLGRRGVHTLIVDRHADPSLETRALGVQARTLEIYAKLGIVDRALKLGRRGTGANLWAQGRKKARRPLGEAGGGLSFRSCSWFSTCRIQHRSASRFRDRRCFLLGDAAHIHIAVGAQGMNSGLQDAYNLACKLALVVEGQADAALLDSYAAERIPIARSLLNTTDRAFRLVVCDSRLAGLLRSEVIARIAALAMTRERIQRFAFRVVSQTGPNYRRSALSRSLGGLSRGAARAGDRFPWLRLRGRADGLVEDLFKTVDDTRLALIVIGQPSAPDCAADFHDLLRVHVVPDDPVNDVELECARIPRPSFYLLRPDGLVGLCGMRVEAGAIRHDLAGHLGIGGARSGAQR